MKKVMSMSLDADKVLKLSIAELQLMRRSNTEAFALACGLILGVGVGCRGMNTRQAKKWLTSEAALTTPSAKQPRGKD